ncbi:MULTISPECIES: hypothetical protein [unclassified Brevibacterium]|uniref:hypothetical protein n=1 Tax=unclassified Brevibacterium TaxID=2614124 RepID=UPI001E5CBA32|nr:MULTISPECIES: hypothetical protein [unclassified Brevibacterium]MCD1284262.1 hypothetical protein [Brevibacterium sp. CCUG 69071]MDK8436129.1 hypothetical protein [Brevibacterium sp. H-BE7]
MSNGNDQPNFPPPPSNPPSNGNTGTGAETPADDHIEDSTTADTTDATQAMPAPSFGEDAQTSGEDQPSDQAADQASDQAQTSDQEPQAPSSTDAPQAPSYTDGQAPPLNSAQSSAPSEPNEAPQYGPGAQQPGQYSGDQQAGAYQQPGQYQPNQQPNQQQGNQYQDNQYQGGQYQGGAPYPGGAGYQSAQSAPGQAGSQPNGQYPTGSGPDAQRTGSGPGGSQAIPQPAPAPGFAGAQAGTATLAETRPERKKSRLPLFIALGSVALVIVLVLVGFLVVHNVNKNNYGPDQVAEDYVSALSEGDFAAAEKIAPSPRPEGTNLDLLSKNFTDASTAKIENAKVDSSQVDGDNGTVVVSYDLDGSTYNVELTAKKDGKQDLFFDKWTLTGPALNVISLDIPAADGLSVNGEDYKAKAGTTSFAVYPGNYDFQIPSSKWVSEAQDTAAVNFPQAFAPGSEPNTDQVSPTTLNLDLSPTDDFQKEVQKQVEAELKKCFDNKSIEPKCDFIKFDPTEIPVGGSDDKLDDLAKKDTAKWNMKDMPKVKADFGSGDTNTGSFFTEKPGKFDFTVQGKKAGSSYFSNGNTLSVSGSVKINGDKLEVEFFDF